MHIAFSMDGMKDMDLLYTWTTTATPEPEEGRVEHYHGANYCQCVIDDTLKSINKSNWKGYYYCGSCDRIANETFKLHASDDSEYEIAFAINTYNGEAARMDISVIAPQTETYDQGLEDLKIALKNRLHLDWQECTWLVDEQASTLCRAAYEKAFTIENNLRAFASKVLIHFLGVNWIKRAGLEKQAESVQNLKEKFVQRVPEFDNINADFLSMTLETLAGVMFEGIIYNDDVVLKRQEYAQIQALGAKQNTKGSSIADYIKARRTVDKHIWNDLFVPYIDDPNDFKATTHSFIEDRNHIAHSKVLSWSAYQIILRDFANMSALILSADAKFEREETADEVLLTWETEQENAEYEKAYYRDRLAGETGMDILGEGEIQDWFDEILRELFNAVYQKYHLDVCFDISDFVTPDVSGTFFSINCPADETENARIDVMAEYCIDDDLGETSTCSITAQDGNGAVIGTAEVRFHNGNGAEGEEGIMVAYDSTEYDTSELEDLKAELFYGIETLNPYQQKLDVLTYESKGAEEYVADFPCEQCGKFGVSVNGAFMTIGRCCYCGYEHELVRCERCNELVSEDVLEHGFCPSCVAYIDKQ